MTKEELEKIKKFAEENFCREETDPGYVYGEDEEFEEFAVTNPWMDHSGRFELDDAGAVKEWGLVTVLDFIEKAKKKIKEEDDALKELANGNYHCYAIEDGGLGIVKAESPEEAERKVRDGYKEHGSLSDDTEVEIYDILQAPFEDAPDVIEIYEYAVARYS